tara:strand:+ start:3766 stop:4533 length:768 start_codon:yes stop_codon:yes gene_type:complete
MYKELKLKYDFEFDSLGIENFYRSKKIQFFFDFIKRNNFKLKGDIYEFGVFKGKSLISTALFLKKIKSKKKIYGFDSFSGFPKYHKYDNIEYFLELYKSKKITKEHYDLIRLNKKIQKKLKNNKVSTKEISTSNDFSNTSYSYLKKKIELLELDNIILIKGNFEKTIPKFFEKNKKIFLANIDCDLYLSYKNILPFIWKNLQNKGMIYLDEYYSLKFPGARIACDEFLQDKSIKMIKKKYKGSNFERCYVKKKVK